MDTETSSTILAIFLGLSLAVTCGFRVFVPLLVVSLGTWADYVKPAPSFEWVGSTPALILLSVATLVEVLAYLIPWLDHALDVGAAPLAAIAGTVLAGGFVVEMHPMMKWSLALIAGGGLAVGTHALLATARAGSTAGSGGLLNPFLAALESLIALAMSLLALIQPILSFLMLVAFVIFAVAIAHSVANFVATRLPKWKAPTEVA